MKITLPHLVLWLTSITVAESISEHAHISELLTQHAHVSQNLAQHTHVSKGLTQRAHASEHLEKRSRVSHRLRLSSRTDEGPVLTVVRMLEELKSQLHKTEATAYKQYNAATELCDERWKAVTWMIQKDTQREDEDEAGIEQASGEITGSKYKIERLMKALENERRDLKKAEDDYATQKKDIQAEHEELDGIVHALQEAIAYVSNSQYKGAALIQFKGANAVVNALGVMVNASMLSTADSSRLLALLQDEGKSNSSATNDEETQDEWEIDPGAPSTMYTSKGGKIIDELERLLTKATDERGESDTKALQARIAFETLEQSINQEIKRLEAELKKERELVGEYQETKAETEGDLSQVESALGTEMQTRSQLKTYCLEKKAAFEEASKLRKKEFDALDAARIEIKKAVDAPAVSTSFLQEESQVNHRASSGVLLAEQTQDIDFRVVKFVRQLSDKVKSDALMQLSMRMANAVRRSAAKGIDPFEKVRGLIHGMINKLLDQQNEEAESWAFCKKEIEGSESTAKIKGAAREKLQTQLDKDEAALLENTRMMQAITQSEVILETDYAKESKLHLDEMATYRQTKADDTKGLEAIKAGRTILQDYYGRNEDTMGGNTGTSEGIFILLENIQSDFTAALAATESNMETAESSFGETTSQYNKQKAENKVNLKYMTKEGAETHQRVVQAKADLKSLDSQLQTNEDYLAQMKKQCVKAGTTHEERIDTLTKELNGLKTALGMLEQETVMNEAFLQRGTTHSQRTLRSESSHHSLRR